MKKFLGTLVFGFKKILDFIFELFIKITEFIVGIADILKGILIFIMIILGILTLIFPPLLVVLFTYFGIFIIIVMISVFAISILGKKLLNLLYKNYYAYSNFLLNYGKYCYSEQSSYKSLNYYKNEYDEIIRKKFEEELRKEEEQRKARQRQQEEYWRKVFEENFNSYTNSTYNQYNRQYNYQQNSNLFGGFKQQYEKSCDILQVKYNATYSEIKSAYRKLAKKYHPDISSEKNATEKFKEINNAFDFLSENNVNRYKNL